CFSPARSPGQGSPGGDRRPPQETSRRARAPRLQVANASIRTLTPDEATVTLSGMSGSDSFDKLLRFGEGRRGKRRAEQAAYIGTLEPDFEKLSDEELAAKTAEFR